MPLGSHLRGGRGNQPGMAPLLESPTSGSGSRDSRGLLDKILGKFSRHISPAFNHERPERSVQMRLYTMHKGQHLLLFIMFLCLFFIAVLMGMAGPRLVAEHVERASETRDGQRGAAAVLPSGPFLILTPALGSYRRQLWVSAKVVVGKPGGGGGTAPGVQGQQQEELFSKEVQAMLTVDGLFLGPRGQKLLAPVVGPVAGQSGLASSNRTRTVRCDPSGCRPFIVAHLGAIEHKRYLINVSLAGLEVLDRHFGVQDVVFTLTTINPDFTQVEVWFRAFFVAATVLVTGLYRFAGSLSDFEASDWSYEQRWVGDVLLPLLLLFDNPFFALTLTSGSTLGVMAPAVWDALCQSWFLFGLLLFWLCVFHGLRQTDRHPVRFYLPKVLLVGTMWFSAFVMAVLQEAHGLRDPSYSHQLAAAHYRSFQLYFMALLALYALYLGFLAFRAFGELRAMNFLDARLKFHAASLTVVLLLVLSVTFSRYGRSVLDDNFVARIYTSYDSEGQFLALYTVLNCYVYVLAYVYSPTTLQVRQNRLLKDNPSFSMVNESDDDDDDEEDDPAGDEDSMATMMLMKKPRCQTAANSRSSQPPLASVPSQDHHHHHLMDQESD